MQTWYRSGLEGYCKAAAQMMGLPDNNSGWGNFGSDLFADGRFDDPAKASKTWSLSRLRAQGRSNRPNLFEDSWLGKHGSNCELEAIHTCVHNLCGASSDSAIYGLYQDSPDTFPVDFHSIVLPAISQGFSAERYHPSDIERFAQGIDKALEKLDPSLPQTFRNFAIPLVAGLIYGPAHTAAQSGTNSPTLRKAHENNADGLLHAIVEDAIVLTQIFSDDVGFVGHSSHFDSSCAILLGRDSDIACYLDKCDPEIAETFERDKLLLFPISHTHKSTSKAHGIIARIGDNWYFYDFSTNGTYIDNPHQPSTVHHGVAALAPGDRIHLGLSESPTDNSAAFHCATTILVSFKLDEANFDDIV